MPEPLTWNVHGRHAAKPRLDAEPIRWTRFPRTLRHFVDETCACKEEKFELWTSGGQRVIRKIVKSTGKGYNSDLMRCAEANDLWQKILRGEAR